MASLPASAKLADGSLDPSKNDMESLLKRFTVREVSLVRLRPVLSALTPATIRPSSTTGLAEIRAATIFQAHLAVKIRILGILYIDHIMHNLYHPRTILIRLHSVTCCFPWTNDTFPPMASPSAGA